MSATATYVRLLRSRPHRFTFVARYPLKCREMRPLRTRRSPLRPRPPCFKLEALDAHWATDLDPVAFAEHGCDHLVLGSLIVAQVAGWHRGRAWSPPYGASTRGSGRPSALLSLSIWASVVGVAPGLFEAPVSSHGYVRLRILIVDLGGVLLSLSHQSWISSHAAELTETP